MIFEHRAPTDRAGGLADRIVDEVDLAGVIEPPLADEPQPDRGRHDRRGGIVTGLGEALVAQVRRLVERELESDRIDRHDGREQRGVAAGPAGDQVAGGNAPVADAAVDRRAQLGEGEIELGLAHHRFVGGDGGFGDALALRPLIEGLLGDGLVTDELLGSGEIGFGEGQVGASLGEIGADLVERGLIRPPVDGEQQVALLHRLAVGEVHGFEIAGDPGPDLHGIDGEETSDVFVLVDDGARDRLGDRHARRRRGRPGRLRALAAARQQRGEQRRRGKSRHRYGHANSIPIAVGSI